MRVSHRRASPLSGEERDVGDGGREANWLILGRERVSSTTQRPYRRNKGHRTWNSEELVGL